VPELPEVELYGRYFAKHALGQRIAAVRVRDDRVLAVRPEELERLRGRSFQAIRRHGKNLFADAGETWLRLHFGMSGDLSYYDGGDPRFARVIFDFEGEMHLAFEDMRLFGVVDLVSSPEDFVRERGLGPDPLSRAFTLRAFRDITATRRGAIKSLLMTQEIIAGVGNLYADETLFQTSVHPRRAVDRLKPAEVSSVYATLRRILLGVIDRHERDKPHPPNWLINHREEGDRCPRCGGTIRRAVVFGRTTYFCGRHQR
jgi:formamidopyrimidine-DNA glycosylase